MNDLEKAKHMLHERELTLAIVKNDKALFETRSHRISGFLGAIEQLDKELEGASLADRVAGKAIALLCLYAKIKQVYADVLSRKAKIMFEQNGIHYEWKQLVDNVLDLNKNGICQFEKAAETIQNPKYAYRAFKALHESFKACK
jgi:hypothetical protein